METNKQKIGLTCGTFDMLHSGHINILKNSKQYCDKLIVALSTDELVVQYKKHYPIIPYDKREAVLSACKYVDMVIPQRNIRKEELIQKLKPDYLFVGDDWFNTILWNQLEEKILGLNNKCKIIYFPYTKGISSTKIREKLKNEN